MPVDEASAATGATYAYSAPWHDPFPDLTPVAPRLVAPPAELGAIERQTSIQAVDLSVDMRHLRFEVTVEEAAETPADHGIVVTASIGPQLMAAGYTVQDGQRTAFGNHQGREATT